MIKSRPVSLIIIRDLGAKSYCKKWSDIDLVELPETILGTTMLEKLLSINVLKLLVSLLGSK